MVSTIIRTEIDSLETQIAQMQAQIACYRERIVSLGKAESMADSAIAALQTAVAEISILSPEAIAALKAAVLDLFGNNGTPGDGDGDQPIEPTPEPELDGQYSEYDPDKYWRQTEPDGSTWELASPIACLLEDKPVPVSPYKFMQLSNAVAYVRKSTGEIITTYIGFSNKTKAKVWGQYLAAQHRIASGFEVREAKRLTDFKYELKIWGIALDQIQRLAECGLTEIPAKSFVISPKCLPQATSQATQPAQIEDIAVGDIVRSITVRNWEYKVVGITDDNYLDCERLGVTPSLRLTMHPGSVELVTTSAEQSALDSIQPPAPTYKLYARGWKANNDNWQIYQEMKRRQKLVVINATEPDF